MLVTSSTSTSSPSPSAVYVEIVSSTSIWIGGGVEERKLGRVKAIGDWIGNISLFALCNGEADMGVKEKVLRIAT